MNTNVVTDTTVSVSNDIDQIKKTDILMVGAGVVSAHMATFFSILEPNWTISIFEAADSPATESSNPWNNAGTGHSALCELNYTPEVNGKVDITKALAINENFQLSRQFWAYAVKNNILDNPKTFINPTPHVSFVHGGKDVSYLKKRYETLVKNPLFEELQYSQDDAVFSKMFPLMAKGRDFSDPVAISWYKDGTDLNYGALTKGLISHLSDKANIFFGHSVYGLTKNKDGWLVSIKNVRTKKEFKVQSKFVFLGAGGHALSLLQKSGIKEGKGFGGFPVSGVFASCNNTEMIEEHSAKVYGKAQVGAPPMSVPHLDTRIINGKKGLLFGPYAGWSPKFLKSGSVMDLPKSVTPSNLIPLMSVGLKEFSLVKYLLKELSKNNQSRIYDMREFIPEANLHDWNMVTAGQRVQIVRKSGRGGNLEFGTEVVNSQDGTISALLGASPGASIVVSAIISALKNCFPEKFDSWKPKIEEMIPSYGHVLNNDPSLFKRVFDNSNKILELT